MKRKISLYFLKRKHFLYFGKRNPAIFSPNFKNKRTPPRENLLYLRKQKPWKKKFTFSFLLQNFFLLNFFIRISSSEFSSSSEIFKNQNFFLRVFYIRIRRNFYIINNILRNCFSLITYLHSSKNTWR